MAMGGGTPYRPPAVLMLLKVVCAGAMAAIALLVASCGTPTDPGPVPSGPDIQSITPSSGPAGGGTEVTIRGANFASGITVTIGGLAATEINVRGRDTLTARTPVSPIAGTVDVVVSLNGRTDVLPSGFRYDTIGPNTAPVIKSITAQGKRPKQPASFADYGETIQITLVVEDAESAATQLVYEWRACGGIFTGSGPQVEWTAPGVGSLPSTCTVDVTIIDGPHVQTRSVVVRLHNSIEEMRGLAAEFLLDFVNNDMPAAQVVRNFSDASSCGKAAELEDVAGIRNDLRHDTHEYGIPTVTIAFGSSCPFPVSVKPSDACAVTAVLWRATVKATGAKETTTGSAYLTGVYETNRWRLCESRFRGTVAPGLRSLSFFR